MSADGQPLQPQDSPGLLMWRATLRWQRLMTSTLGPLGLTHVQFVLLASTWWLTTVAGEAPSQKRLADFAGTDPMMTSQVVRALESKGLITRAAHPTDARSRTLGVTTAGAALAEEAVALVEVADSEFFAVAPHRSALLDGLRRLAAG